MRRRIVSLVFLAVCAIAGAPGIVNGLARWLTTNADKLVRGDLGPVVAAMQAAETEALGAAMALRSDEARAELYQSRLDDALRDGGARVLSVSTTTDTPVGAGLLQRHLELRLSCPPDALGGALAAIRSSMPTLQVERVTFDAAAISLAAPDPLLTVQGFVWVAPASTSP